MVLSRGKLAIAWLLAMALAFHAGWALSCGAQITENTVLDQDLSCDGTALIINASQITLDCQGHIIGGRGLGNGIEVVVSNTIVRDCKVEGFENAVVVQGAQGVSIQGSVLSASLMGASLFESQSATLTDNIIANNSFYGVYAKDSPGSVWTQNEFSGNREDAYELMTPVEETPVIKPEPQESPGPRPPRTPQVQPPAPKEPVTTPIALRLSQEQREKLDTQKTVTISPNRTTYELELTAKKDLSKMEITEEIPYEVAQTSAEVSSDTPFTVVKEGEEQKGPVLRFIFTDLKVGDKRVVRYQISKEVLSEFALKPTTFILLEEAINPGSLWAIRVLFSVFLILLGTWIYLLKRLHAHRHYGLYLIVFATLVVLFVAVNLTVEIVVSEFANNIIMGTVLTLLIIALGFADVKNALKLRQVPKEKQEIEDMEL